MLMLMERLTKTGTNLGFIDSNTLPNYEAVYERLRKYEDLEEECIREHTWGLKILLKKWKEFFEDIQELYEYRNLKKQGRVMEFPCAVGDEFFVLWRGRRQNQIRKMEVKRITICERKRKEYLMEFVGNRGCLFRFFDNDFGKIVFLTKEEAEQAIKEKNVRG